MGLMRVDVFSSKRWNIIHSGLTSSFPLNELLCVKTSLETERSEDTGGILKGIAINIGTATRERRKT